MCISGKNGDSCNYARDSLILSVVGQLMVVIFSLKDKVGL